MTLIHSHPIDGRSLIVVRRDGKEMCLLTNVDEPTLSSSQAAILNRKPRRNSGDLLIAFSMCVRDTYTRRSCKRARNWPHKKTESPPGTPKIRRASEFSCSRERLPRIFISRITRIDFLISVIREIKICLAIGWLDAIL